MNALRMMIVKKYFTAMMKALNTYATNVLIQMSFMIIRILGSTQNQAQYVHLTPTAMVQKFAMLEELMQQHVTRYVHLTMTALVQKFAMLEELI